MKDVRNMIFQLHEKITQNQNGIHHPRHLLSQDTGLIFLERINCYTYTRIPPMIKYSSKLTLKITKKMGTI